MTGFPLCLKDGVDLKGIAPHTVLAALIVYGVYETHGVPLVITSVMDSKHMTTSLHYKGSAFDCRLPSRYTNDPQTDRQVAMELKAALGKQFDVVLESDHIHVEFDPKEG